MKSTFFYHPVLVWVGAFIFLTLPLQAQTDDVLEQLIQFPRTKATRYELFEKITTQTGMLFIYNSDLVDDKKVINLPAGSYTLRKAIYTITGNHSLTLRIIGSHILLKEEPPEGIVQEAEAKAATVQWLTIEGRIIDSYTLLPIPSATITITGTSTGTISNQDGVFRIHIPDTLLHSSLYFSHLGYEPLETGSGTLTDGTQSIALEPKIIPLQEIVVRLVSPTRMIDEMLEKRPENYAADPVYMTTFYREGVEKRKKLITLTEAVFKVYKNPYDTPFNDQVKLLKMRKYKNVHEKDTVITKIKSGPQGSLMLDMVKNLPDFLEVHAPNNPYLYAHSDIIVIDNRLANVISFEQRADLRLPLYKGEIYIDNDNDALLMVRFEIHPDYVEKATSMFVERKSKGVNIKSRKIVYTVSYKPWNGTYYINHIRGDLHFHIRKKGQLFSSPIHTWFEMMTGRIDTTDVQRFNRKEALPHTTVLSDAKYIYDPSFWENFNTILPEEELYDALSKITAKIEETEE